MCLFKDWQEVAYPGVHPHTEVSGDSEFMGTLSVFPTFIFFVCLHMLTLYLFFYAYHFQVHNQDCHLSHRQSCCRPLVAPRSLSTLQLIDLMTFLVLALDPFSMHTLFSFLLNQLNCLPSSPPTSVFWHLHLPAPSCFCSDIITLCLNQYVTLTLCEHEL